MRKIEKQSKVTRLLSIHAVCAAVLAVVLGAALSIGSVWASPAGADHTRFWRQSDYADFQNGTATGVALRSDGAITLAPKFVQVSDPNIAYLRTLRTDSRGNVYAAGGSNAKVIRVDASGKESTVFESTEMTAQALAVDKSDNLYVGTSPDGRIYKVTTNGQKSVFFEPKTKYIWDLIFGSDGTLYAATGDAGKIFSIKPDGKGDIFFSSDESHIRALVLDGKGNLIAGTEPNGWVMRIPLAANSATRQTTASGESGRRGYVLYETAKKEVTSIALDASGNLYVAAIGDKPRTPPATTLPAQQPAQPAPAQGQNVTITIGGAQAAGPLPAPAVPSIPFPTSGSSAVYRIAADGSPEEVWSSPEDIVYTLVLSAEGKLLVGIGNRGAVIEVRDDRVFSRLARTESEQVTGLARMANGKIVVATSNPGKIFALGPELASEGTFESQTYDARIFSRWGRLTWWGENAAGSGAAPQFYVRAGNTSDPSNNWSDWSGPYSNGAQADVSAARFVQWKAVLRGGNKAGPEVSWVELAYLPKNVGPRISGIAVQSPGVRASGFGAAAQGGAAATIQLRLPNASGSQNASGGAQRTQGDGTRFDAPVQGSAQKGFQSVLWSADDDNDDDLTYTIFYRGENERNWKLLKEKVDQKFYSWDTTTMPDGAYYLKVVASDVRSNPADQALESSRESERFVVDNTSPVVSDVAAETTGDAGATVRFRATDSTSVIARAQYSLDAGEWIPVRPAGELSDALDERYVLTLRNLAPGEHTVSVRVNDRFENEAAAKVTFSIAAKR